jgi:transposase InsO family protein
MNAALELSRHTDIKSACEALQIPRACFYRFQQTAIDPAEHPTQRPSPPLALSAGERKQVLQTLHEERFQDLAPHQVYASLLDEGTYYCSIRTMYRLLEAEHGCVKERRAQVQRPHYRKPELLAQAPNQVWSWDITKLKSIVKWTYFYLYVIIDIYSRYVVGWMVAHREQDALAKRLIEETCLKQHIQEGQLTIHADRGSSMKSKSVALLLSDLGIIKSHSRPHISNDNPFSESQFKTLKYCPSFPGQFGCIQETRAFCQQFFNWYNDEHHHCAIGLLTPAQLHYGLAERIQTERANVLMAAFESNPQRFKNRIPLPPPVPEAVWINKPKLIAETPAERRRGVAETQSPGNEVQATPPRRSGQDESDLFLKNELVRCTLNN